VDLCYDIKYYISTGRIEFSLQNQMWVIFSSVLDDVIHKMEVSYTELTEGIKKALSENPLTKNEERLKDQVNAYNVNMDNRAHNIAEKSCPLGASHQPPVGVYAEFGEDLPPEAGTINSEALVMDAPLSLELYMKEVGSFVMVALDCLDISVSVICASFFVT